MSGRLGDRWGAELAEPDSSAQSLLSVDYYRDKIREFQMTMNALDSAYRAVVSARDDSTLDFETASELDRLIAEYEARRFLVKQTAEAINLGASAWNAAGGRMPQLSIPGTLGLAFIPPAAFLAAVAAVGGLTLWASGWISSAARVMEQSALIALAEPEQRSSLIENWQAVLTAQQQTESSPLVSIAGAVKWLAIGGLGFLAYRAWRASRS